MARMLAVFAEFEREIVREQVRTRIAKALKELRLHERAWTASLKTDQRERAGTLDQKRPGPCG